MLHFNKQWCLQEVNLWRYDLFLVSLFLCFVHAPLKDLSYCACYISLPLLQMGLGQISLLPKPNISGLYNYIFFFHCQSVRFHVKSWLPARSIVMECLLSRGNVDPSGEIMVLDRFCPVRSWYLLRLLAIFVLSTRYPQLVFCTVCIWCTWKHKGCT
jgi:hypothetical protein